jgi:O-antigen ligase
LIVSIAMFALAPLLGWSLAYGLASVRKQEWLAFGALLMIALVPAIVRWPVISTFGLYAFVATSLDAFPFLPGGGTISKPVGALAGAVLLGAGLIERRLDRPPAAALWWAAFTLWATLSTMWAVDAEVALQRLPTVLSLFGLYFVAVCFRPSQRELYSVCALTVLGGVLAAALAYFFGMQQEATSQAVRGRLVLQDMESDPNMLGRVLLLPLALAIAGFIGARGIIARAMAIGSATFVGLGIFISMSRGAVVAIAAMFLVLLYRMRVRWHIVAIMAVLLMVTTLMPEAFYERFDALISGEDDGSGRLQIWQTGLRVLERSGIFGAGLYNFPLLYSTYVPGRHTAAHNIYLTALVDLGIPGLAMMLAAIGSGLYAVWKIRRAAPLSTALTVLEATCIGTLTSGMFFDILFTKSFWLVWILLTWAMCSAGRSDDASPASVLRG